MRPTTLRLLLLLLALLPAAPAGAGEPAPRGLRLVFTGTVTRPGGRPVRGARVALVGAPGAATAADAEGRYVLTHAVPDVTEGPPRRLVLRASHRGWNLALPSGAPALAIELSPAPARGGGVRLEVRSNDAAVARAVALALGEEGEAVVALEARFVRLIGAEDPEVPELTALEVATLDSATLAAEPPAPAGTDSTPVAVAPEPVAAGSATTPAPGAPAPLAAGPATAAPADSAPELAASAPPPAAAPVVSPAASVPAARPAGADTVSRPGIHVLLRPDTAVARREPEAPPARSPLRVVLGRAVPDRRTAPAGGCGCWVAGTVEVRPESPVYGGPRVVVTLADLPALRDTVAIFMGPPRAFELGRVPCGRHELVVLPLSGRRMVRVEPDSTGFACVADGTRQFRVVLEPR